MSIDFNNGMWLNEPQSWKADDDGLTIVTDAKTDFWRETYYGFTRDSGHFLGFDTGSSFTAVIRIRGEFRTLYDQAGLMVRIDDTKWVKTGVEFTDGELFLSTVVTNGKSDWSISQPFKEIEDFYIRVTVNNGAMRIQASRDGKFWPLLRLAPFPIAERYQVGPTACTPERSGLSVNFSEFLIGPAITTDLHDLT
ncbi:regulation of enolase 1 [Agrobacterium tumefaciens]|uniref:Regulation of enolase 1 n=1 Tax=Agrobacterium tumefaciens TaxID=358 RepID=A0A0D0KYF2_AGRTU|nr:regulation of enolase 1 [Agrobacterium tumefaciens]